jgi:hypothetical protein
MKKKPCGAFHTFPNYIVLGCCSQALFFPLINLSITLRLCLRLRLLVSLCAVMGRVRKFNSGKKKQRNSAGQKRHPTLSQYVKSYDQSELMAQVCCSCGQEDLDKCVKCDPYPMDSCILKLGLPKQTLSPQLLASTFHPDQFANACTYCSEALEMDECHIDDMSNQLCCSSCLWSSDRSANWWGNDTEIASDEEDSFDVDSGSADDELIAEVPWHIQVSLMRNNQKMEPSRGGGKTKWYSMVTKGNKRGTFVSESKAVKNLTDKMRKREQRLGTLHSVHPHWCAHLYDTDGRSECHQAVSIFGQQRTRSGFWQL